MHNATIHRVTGNFRITKGSRIFDLMHNIIFMVDAVIMAQFSGVFVNGRNTGFLPPNITFVANQFELSVVFPMDIAPRVFQSVEIEEVTFSIMPSSELKPPPPPLPGQKQYQFHLGTLPNTWLNIIKPVYVDFFERHRPWIASKYGSRDWKTWPDIFAFGYMVRNWISHSEGAVKFDNPNAPNVRWHHLTYGPADHDKPVVGGLTSALNLADVIILINDITVELDNLGCPARP